MRLSLVNSACFLLVSLQLTSSQICNDDRECYNNNAYCDDINCNLICNGTQSCANLKYKCNSTDPSSTCTVQCNGYEACKNIDIVSTATINEINCIDWPSCIEANIHCNSWNTNATSTCTINCNSARSCQLLSLYCSSTMSHCTLNCQNEPDSCNNINYDCHATSSCQYNCPNQDIGYYCADLLCPQCGISTTTTTTTTATTTTSLIVEETEIVTEINVLRLVEVEDVDPSRLSSAGYHVVFGFFFFFTFIYIGYCIVINPTFFKKLEVIDSVFSLLPIILFVTFYETLSCWIMGGTNTYLSSRDLSVGAYFWSILIPLQFIMIMSHILIWYLYLIYYGRNASLNYLYFLSSLISPAYPRSIYFIPMIILLVWSFILMIISYSLNTSSSGSARSFLSLMIILECVCGVWISLKLMSIALTYVQMQFILSKHEDDTMKLLFFCSISVLIVFMAIFIMSIGIWDEGALHFQSYLADISRVFQLMFEVVFIILCSVLFFYIPPSPELHKSHRSSFHAVNQNMMDLDEDEDDCVYYGFDDPFGTLIPSIKVFVYNHDEWVLGTVQKLASDNTLCFVKKDILSEEKKYENNIIIVDLNNEIESHHIKLALYGVDPIILNKVHDVMYNLDGIPTFLIQIRDKLFDLNGHLEQGIFRIEAMKSEYNIFKFAVEQQRMNTFDYHGFDVHILSNLIKDFYRSIPDPIKCLSCFDFSNDDINNDIMLLKDIKMLLNDKNDNYKFERQISKILTVWLWKLCADIVENQEDNKMSINSLSIVISPNLYYQEASDTKHYLAVQANVERFCSLGIEYMVHKRSQAHRQTMSL